MSRQPDPYLWMTVEDYAASLRQPASEIVSAVLDGGLDGERFADRWYVPRPRVTLYYADPDDRSAAELRLLACQIGSYLTAGRGEVAICLRRDDPAREPTLNLLMTLGDELHEEPVEFDLAGEHWIVDCSLYRDLGAALFDFDLEQSLEELLREFPPTAPELD